MIKLEEIKKVGNIVTAVVIPEDSERFTIKVDIDKAEVIETSADTSKFHIQRSVTKAMVKLWELAMEFGDKIPSKNNIAWY